MQVFLWLLVILNQLFILVLYLIDLDQYDVSEFIVHEAFGQKNDPYSRLRKQLHKVLPEVRLLRATKLAVFFIIQVALFSYLLGPLRGIVVSLSLVMLIRVLSRIVLLASLSNKLFERCLNYAVKVAAYLRLFWLLLGLPERRALRLPVSTKEFQHQLQRLPSTVVAPRVRQQLEALLAGSDKTVAQLMTPLKQIVSVPAEATLGPVLLASLERSQHGYFPVVDQAGQPQGVLALSDIDDIASAKTHDKVKSYVRQHAVWINDDQSVELLLQRLLETKRYMLLVKNHHDQFAGVVTVGDVFEKLLAIGSRSN